MIIIIDTPSTNRHLRQRGVAALAVKILILFVLSLLWALSAYIALIEIAYQAAIGLVDTFASLLPGEHALKLAISTFEKYITVFDILFALYIAPALIVITLFFKSR